MAATLVLSAKLHSPWLLFVGWLS